MKKPQTSQGWVNGGFVIEPIFEFIEDNSTILEEGPLEALVEKGQLAAYRHEGFGIAWILLETKTY